MENRNVNAAYNEVGIQECEKTNANLQLIASKVSLIVWTSHAFLFFFIDCQKTGHPLLWQDRTAAKRSPKFRHLNSVVVALNNLGLK